ncbi:4849_t:CDS:2, partial [Dentiscutata erythropus]
ELCKEEAEDLFNEIDSNTIVELELSTNIIEYLQDLLGGDIESALSKIESQLLLWVREPYLVPASLHHLPDLVMHITAGAIFDAYSEGY